MSTLRTQTSEVHTKIVELMMFGGRYVSWRLTLTVEGGPKEQIIGSLILFYTFRKLFICSRASKNLHGWTPKPFFFIYFPFSLHQSYTISTSVLIYIRLPHPLCLIICISGRLHWPNVLNLKRFGEKGSKRASKLRKESCFIQNQK